jgi:tRNA threonylcarbamoyladenosine biosynthesis protein TsaB
MKIFALDTATQSCSVALIEDKSLLAELTRLNRRTHSRHIMALIDMVCGLSDIKIGDVDAFAVTVGPGSFTGLRIGISTIKGLAFSLNKPVIGISSLDALAWQCAQSPYLICSLLDARKKEGYFCRYRFRNEELVKQGDEKVGAPVEALRDIQEPCIFVGNAAQMYREKISAELGELAHFAARGQNAIRASSIAWLSMAGFSGRGNNDVELLTPRYIRKPDAQIKVPGNKG